ncbi:MAG TPA: hypothetical protein DDW90_02750 [Cyanobacteria bacterium UBA9971]|nr:hypothetical protein [Cyanobacteria bacterium UBA9971]
MEKNEIIELNIEKLTYGGEGLGRIDGMTVFVPDTVAGDYIKAKIVSVKKNFANAEITEIIMPSEHRIKPFCPLANACGGCQWQHINYEEQLRAKKQIIEECMQKIAGIEVSVKDVLKSDEVKEYRCKVQYPVQQTKISKRFLAGYYRKNTHDIVNIKFCPIQPSIIDEIAEYLRKKAQELDLTAYNEKNKKGLIRHFVFRYSQTNKDLLLTIVVSPPPCPPPQGGGRMVAEGAAPPPPAPNKVDFLPELKKLCAAVKNEFPAISGVLVNYNTKHSNVILGKETELIEGKDYIEEILEGRTFHISAESFFQVNPLTAQKMFLEVRGIVEDKVSGYFSDTVILSASEESVQHTKTAIIPNGTDPSALPQDDKKIQHDNFEKPSILDVYAGSGSFSMFLSDLASNITAVEESESSVNDGLENLRLNKIENITFIQGNADEVLKKMTGGEQKPENEDEEPIIIEPQAFDIVILDPPRRGCSESVIESIKKLAAKYIIYISCNPSTLARDVKLLSEDFIPEYIQPVDMFCHTYHVESILVLTKK